YRSEARCLRSAIRPGARPARGIVRPRLQQFRRNSLSVCWLRRVDGVRKRREREEKNPAVRGCEAAGPEQRRGRLGKVESNLSHPPCQRLFLKFFPEVVSFT